MITLNKKFSSKMYVTIVAEAHNKLGIIYEKEGKLTDAVTEYSKAVELHPKYAEAYYGRGLAHYHLNDLDKAWEDIQFARNLGFAMGKERLSHLSKAVSSENGPS